jgi:hypothetical protein
MNIQLPNADEVGHALTALLRREVEATALKTPPAKPLAIAGLYHDGNGQLLGAVMADLPFAARSGACFSLIPADVAQESIEAGVLDEGMRENFAEVLNVASRLFTRTGGARVALKATCFPPAALPPEIANPAALTRSAHFEVNIDDYGSGIVRLCALS